MFLVDATPHKEGNPRGPTYASSYLHHISRQLKAPTITKYRFICVSGGITQTGVHPPGFRTRRACRQDTSARGALPRAPICSIKRSSCFPYDYDVQRLLTRKNNREANTIPMRWASPPRAPRARFFFGRGKAGGIVAAGSQELIRGVCPAVLLT